MIEENYPSPDKRVALQDHRQIVLSWQGYCKGPRPGLKDLYHYCGPLPRIVALVMPLPGSYHIWEDSVMGLIVDKLTGIYLA